MDSTLHQLSIEHPHVFADSVVAKIWPPPVLAPLPCNEIIDNDTANAKLKYQLIHGVYIHLNTDHFMFYDSRQILYIDRVP